MVKGEKWNQVIPIPEEAGQPLVHPKLGAPSQAWAYRNGQCQRTGIVCRFDLPCGEKEYRPLAYFRSEQTGCCEWRWQAFDSPRPLYGLDRLAERLEAQVIVVEGEKSADAADELIGEDMVCLTWPGGSNSVSSADFTPLNGRLVTIWPDYDQPGFKAALAVAKAAADVRAECVLIVAPPSQTRMKWDLANALEEGWDGQRVMDWIERHSLGLDEFNRIFRERFPESFSDSGNSKIFGGGAETEFVGDDDADEDGLYFLPPLSPFPIEVLPDTYQEIVRQAALAFVVPLAIPATALLALASTCIGRTRGIMVKAGWVEYANLYLALVARSGTGKTPCTQAFFRPLYDMEQELYQKYSLDLEQYNQRIENIKSDKKKRQEPLPTRPTLIQYHVDDATIESVSDALSVNERGVLWFQDELTGLLKSMGRYSPKGDDGSIKSRLNSAHNCGSWKVNRRTKDVVNIPHACLSVFGTIQPKVLPQIFTDADAVSGFLPRFLFVLAETESPPLFTEDEFGNDRMEVLRNLTRRMLKLNFDERGNPKILELSSEARREFIEWHDKQALEQWHFADEDLVNSCLAKLRSHCLRLCLILHIVEAISDGRDGSETVNVETMRRAIILADWLKANQKRVTRILEDQNVTETTPIDRRIMVAILDLESEIDRGMLPTFRIKDKVNEDVGDAFQITSAMVGKCCGKLGLVVGMKMPDGKKRGVKIPEGILTDFRKLVNPSVPAVQPVQNVYAERIAQPDGRNFSRLSRPMENEPARTAQTEDKTAVHPAGACYERVLDGSDGSDGNCKKVAQQPEQKEIFVLTSPGE